MDVGTADQAGWNGSILDVVCTVSSIMLTSLCRRLLLPPQVAQGALLRALFHPSQDHVLFACEGPPREVQRMSEPLEFSLAQALTVTLVFTFEL